MKLNLTTAMLLGLFLGCLTGVIISQIGIDPGYFKPLGDLFITLIRMVVVPLVFTTLVAGAAAIGDVSRLGSIATKSLIFYMGTTAVAVFIGLVVANVLQPGSGLHLAELSKTVDSSQLNEVALPSLLSVFMGIVPLNPIKAMADANMLQIIFFAVLFGMAISTIGEKGKVAHQLFESLADAMLKLTSLVMWYAPIGVFGLITYTVGHHGIAVLLPLLKLIGVMFVASACHIAFVYLPCIRFVGIPLPIFFKEMSAPLLIAFSSASSAAALSTNLITVEKLGASKTVASFTIPLGNTINMDGTAIYMGICAIFAATIYNIPMPIDKQLMVIIMAILASIGTMGVPGAGFIMITMVFTQVGIPLEATVLIAGVDRLLDMIRTSLNVLGDATGALVISKTEEHKEPSKSQI